MKLPKQCGAALVEFALILPLLLLLTFITTEYARALYQYNTLAKSVRDAARYLSVQSPSDSSENAIARDRAIYGNPAGSGSPLAIGLTATHIPDSNIVWALHGSEPVINTVSITISGYTFTPLFASVFGVNFGNLNFSPISATMRAAL